MFSLEYELGLYCSHLYVLVELGLKFYLGSSLLYAGLVSFYVLWVFLHQLIISCFQSFLYGLGCRATTHSDLVVRAKKLGVQVQVVYNASVMNAVGICGLQLYRYGETVSIPFFTETWRPDSFYEKIQRNRSLGLHTLCLLGEDIFFYSQ